MAENSANATVVGTAGATDPNGNTLTYSITAGNAAGAFAINASTGQITVANGALLDYEGGTRQYTLTVQVSDGSLTDTATVTINVTDVNEAPEFDSPNNPDTYTLDAGYGSTTGIWIGRAQATDPDAGQTATLTYAITAGNPDGVFKIHSGNEAGWIQLAKDLPNAGPFVLTITATDSGGLSDTATVTINVRTMVVITGDVNGAERPTDRIRLEIIRLSSDLSQPLNVTYDVNWNNTEREDLNAGVLTDAPPAAQTRTITIPAGQDRFIFEDLVPVADAADGTESFTVTLRQSADYVLPNGTVDLKTAKPGFGGKSAVVCTIREGYTLYGAVAPGPAADDTNEIDLNDIKQGGFGDCYFMAAIGAMALRDPQSIRNAIRNNGNGTATVTFHHLDGQVVNITVPIGMEGGLQAAISGDTDAAGNYEVWPQVLEAAYQAWIGWTDLNNGGSSATVWQHLTGQPATTLNTTDFTSATLRTRIEADWAAGKKICVGTWGADKKEDWNLPDGGGRVVSNHAYVVQNVTATGIVLYNPWGHSHVTIPWDLIKYYVGSVYVQ